MKIGSRTLLAKTCPYCGEFKQASEFRLRTGRKGVKYHQTDCEDCKTKMAKASDKANNDRLRALAGNSRRLWTEPEIKHVWELTDAGFKNREIAEALGRSLSSVNIAKSRFPRTTNL